MAKGRAPLPALDPADVKRALQPLAEQFPSATPPNRPPASAAEYASAIERLWTQAQEGFLRIGQHLEEAQARLPAEEFAALVGRLPFGKAVRTQLMTAYRAVRTGGLPHGIERAGYSVVYQITTLKPEERERAASEGLIRPDTRREEVIAFKRRIRLSRTGGGTAAARRELDRLLAERDRIDRRIAELRAELED